MKNIQNNQGIALFIALMFLLISTLLGVASLRSSLFNEKMTLNTMQREKAFEAAEATLIEGENLTRDLASEIIGAAISETEKSRTVIANAVNCRAVIGDQGGICVPIEHTSDNTTLDHWLKIDSNVWDNAGRHRVANETIKNQFELNSSPKYIVEFIGYIVDDNGKTNCMLGNSSTTGTITNSHVAERGTWPYCNLDRYNFRITVLATAGNYDETHVMLQSTFVVDQQTGEITNTNTNIPHKTSGRASWREVAIQ